MKLRALIVDDERIARRRLRRLLAGEPTVEVIGECADGPSAVQATTAERPDVIFLDVQMPGMDGFDMLDALGVEREPLVVFVTAFDEHAVRAFEACAVDYLLKPVSPERLAQTLGRVRIRLAERHSPGVPGGESERLPWRTAVRSNGRVTMVSAEEIDWIESAGNYAIIHCGAQNHILRQTTSALEASLPAGHFLRVNRSAIVNLRSVKEVCWPTDGDALAILNDGQRVPITRGGPEIRRRLLRSEL
jgi:two-component system LytT family response regulator